MSFGTGFVTGFANTLASGMLDRQKEARDYFNKQIDYARTTGLENRNKTKATVNANLSLAKQLEAAGVPKDVIMAQIKMDPNNLEGFYKQAETLRAGSAEEGKNLTPEQWREIYKAAEDFKAPDEDLSTFITRMYDPISQAVNDESFEDDPQGSLVSSLLGFNQMAKARAGLKKTMIANGLTADQLIRYGDSAPVQGDGTVVVTDYTKIPQKADKLSPSQIGPVAAQIDEVVIQRLGAVEAQFDGDVPPEELDALRTGIVDQYYELYSGQVDRATLTRIVDLSLASKGWIAQEELVTDPDTITTTSLAPGAGVGSPEPKAAPTDSPTASGGSAPITDEEVAIVQPPPGVIIKGKARYLSFVIDNGDGYSVWIDQDGEELTILNAGLRANASK